MFNTDALVRKAMTYTSALATSIPPMIPKGERMAQMKDLTVRINVQYDPQLAERLKEVRMGQVWRSPQVGDRLAPRNGSIYERGRIFEVWLVTKRTIYVKCADGCTRWCTHTRWFEPDTEFILYSQAKFRAY